MVPQPVDQEKIQKRCEKMIHMSIPTTLAETVREKVAAGSLLPGDRLPATRALAERLGVSRGSVVAAYDQLAAEGFVVADHGGTRINPDLPSARPSRITPSDPGGACPRRGRGMGALRPGEPYTGGLTTRTWRAAWRAAAADPSHGYLPPGSAALREAVAEHVRRYRGVAAEPLITSGARDGLRLLLAAVPGAVAVENPGYPSLRTVPASLGREVIPIPVDDEGIRVDRLRCISPTPGLVVVTPGHQYPRGGQMSAARRAQLVAWAHESGALIVEDDYDAELGDPASLPPALSALNRDRVAMLGSFAKTLSPGLGLGYLVPPEWLSGRLAELSVASSTPPTGIVQDAVATFLAAGGLRARLARMRHDYAARHAVFLEIFGAAASHETGGLNGVIALPDARAEARVVSRARARGFAVEGLSTYWAASEDPSHGSSPASAEAGSGDTSRGAVGAGIVVGLGSGDLGRVRELLTGLRILIAGIAPESLEGVVDAASDRAIPYDGHSANNYSHRRVRVSAPRVKEPPA